MVSLFEEDGILGGISKCPVCDKTIEFEENKDGVEIVVTDAHRTSNEQEFNVTSTSCMPSGKIIPKKYLELSIKCKCKNCNYTVILKADKEYSKCK